MTISRLIAPVMGILLMLGASACHKKGSAAAGTEIPGVAGADSTSTPVVSESSTLSAPVFPASNASWNSLEVPVQVNLTAPKNFNISGRLSMVQGRELLISLRFIGFEVGQLYANTDSIWVVERYHKWYLAESLSALGARTGLNLSDIQGLLIGRPVRALPLIEGIEAVYKVDEATSRLEGLGILRGGIPVFGIAYGPQVSTPGGVMASDFDFAAESGKFEVGGSISFSTGQARWNSGLKELKFQRPTTYRRIRLSEIAGNL